MAFVPAMRALCGCAGNYARAALDPAHDKILYAVATTHLDDPWNCTIQDMINSWIPSTLHQNLAFFSEARFAPSQVTGDQRYPLYQRCGHCRHVFDPE